MGARRFEEGEVNRISPQLPSQLAQSTEQHPRVDHLLARDVQHGAVVFGRLLGKVRDRHQSELHRAQLDVRDRVEQQITAALRAKLRAIGQLARREDRPHLRTAGPVHGCAGTSGGT